MKCCTGNLLPLLQREGGRVKNFGKNTSEGPIWEKKIHNKQFSWAPKAVGALGVPPALLSWVGFSWELKNQGNSATPGERGGPNPEVVRGNIKERGFFILIFAAQKMSPPFWVGLSRNWGHEHHRVWCAPSARAGCRTNVGLVTLSCLQVMFRGKKSSLKWSKISLQTLLEPWFALPKTPGL